MAIYQHYREEEHPFVDQILSLKEQVERYFISRLTDFLNPREQKIVSQIVGGNNPDLKLQFFGGTEYTERKRAILAPYYEEIEESQFEITLLQAKYATKFITLTHRDVMGAFLSLGVDRKKLGDIYVSDGIIQIVTSEDLSPFVLANLTTIKNAKVQFEVIPIEELLIEKPNWVTFERNVSSLRLDVIIKEIYQLSRKDAASFIEQKRTRVNYKTVDDPAYIVEPEDLISVRGKGRSKFIEELGLTRKGRKRITVAILK